MDSKVRLSVALTKRVMSCALVTVTRWPRRELVTGTAAQVPAAPDSPKRKYEYLSTSICSRTWPERLVPAAASSVSSESPGIGGIIVGSQLLSGAGWVVAALRATGSAATDAIGRFRKPARAAAEQPKTARKGPRFLYRNAMRFIRSLSFTRRTGTCLARTRHRHARRRARTLAGRNAAASTLYLALRAGSLRFPRPSFVPPAPR